MLDVWQWTRLISALNATKDLQFEGVFEDSFKCMNCLLDNVLILFKVRGKNCIAAKTQQQKSCEQIATVPKTLTFLNWQDS